MSSSSKVSQLMLFLYVFMSSVLISALAGNFYRDFDILFGDRRAMIRNGGQILTLSLDKASGSGIRSKDEYLFGRIDMQIKLVRGNSAGTVTTYYVSIHATRSFSISRVILFRSKVRLFLEVQSFSWFGGTFFNLIYYFF
jgi:hypothetical protein